MIDTGAGIRNAGHEFDAGLLRMALDGFTRTVDDRRQVKDRFAPHGARIIAACGGCSLGHSCSSA